MWAGRFPDPTGFKTARCLGPYWVQNVLFCQFTLERRVLNTVQTLLQHTPNPVKPLNGHIVHEARRDGENSKVRSKTSALNP
jgi:hypothetical protein